MPIILVVDDSQVDRRLMGKFLGKDVDWLIQYAENGHDALDQMQDALPDVVVTDLLMPEMNGIELVTAIRDNYPDLPVILATAHGSESLAVEALDRGAASYVPKNDLADKLLDTVEQVLGMASSGRQCERLSQCLANHQCTFRLDNDPATPSCCTVFVGLIKTLNFDLIVVVARRKRWLGKVESLQRRGIVA